MFNKKNQKIPEINKNNFNDNFFGGTLVVSKYDIENMGLV